MLSFCKCRTSPQFTPIKRLNAISSEVARFIRAPARVALFFPFQTHAFRLSPHRSPRRIGNHRRNMDYAPRIHFAGGLRHVLRLRGAICSRRSCPVGIGYCYLPTGGDRHWIVGCARWDVYSDVEVLDWSVFERANFSAMLPTKLLHARHHLRRVSRITRTESYASDKGERIFHRRELLLVPHPGTPTSGFRGSVRTTGNVIEPWGRR